QAYDAFRCGYATAILWANAYAYDEATGELVNDEDATYAYQGPGRWWEGIGIDFTDAEDFLRHNYADLLAVAGAEFEQHGHDFALTRNGHGAGFWDRGYGPIGDVLTEHARMYGEHSVLTDGTGTVSTF